MPSLSALEIAMFNNGDLDIHERAILRSMRAEDAWYFLDRATRPTWMDIMSSREFYLGFVGEQWSEPLQALIIPVDQPRSIIVYREGSRFTVVTADKSIHTDHIMMAASTVANIMEEMNESLIQETEKAVGIPHAGVSEGP